MKDNEYKTARLIIVKNVVLVITTGVTVLGLYYMSRSFHALWALLMLTLVSTLHSK